MATNDTLEEMTPAQAASAGLGWVPKGHPLYGTAGYVGSSAGSALQQQAPDRAMPVQTVSGQAQAAQTYSATPGAAPTQNTMNQGAQDVVRNSYLQRATQGTTIDRNDPNIRQQSDAYGAAQERARRNAVDQAAEASFAAGTRGSGAERTEQRMISENAARNVGQFEAALVGRELENRRDEIKTALEAMRGQITVEQQATLQRELANLEAAIKRESLAQSGSLGAQDIQLRDKLGTGALNADLMRILLQNQQFDKNLGFDIGNAEMGYYLRQLGL